MHPEFCSHNFFSHNFQRISVRAKLDSRHWKKVLERVCLETLFWFTTHGGEKSPFFAQKSVTFDPVVRFGWAPFMKWRLLNRLSSWPSLEFRRRQMCCWGCQEGTCSWISRYFPPISDILQVMETPFDMPWRVVKLGTSYELCLKWGFSRRFLGFWPVF